MSQKNKTRICLSKARMKERERDMGLLSCVKCVLSRVEEFDETYIYIS